MAARCLAALVPALVLLICASRACAYRSVPAARCEVRLRTEGGVACGRARVAERAHHYVSFRGLPYAKPPVGRRRFAAPEAVDPWEYLLDATEDGPACPQKEVIYGRMTCQPRGQSEDCLYLNLHVPSSHFPTNQTVCNKKKGLPILVMLHGGGFQTGSGLTDVHGPGYLMTTESVIVVSINFRLNVFGFMCLGTAEIPGNQGLRDALHGLRWVKRNARAFGGDPDNITLMGQSCGASMVHLLSLSQAAEGLFHKIFMMSGHAIPIYFATNPEFGKQLATGFIQQLGINLTSSDCIHKKLAKLPLEDIMYANSILQYETGLTSFVPCVEGKYPGVERVLSANPLDLMAKGMGSQYPMLLGFTSNEAEFFKWTAFIWQITQRIQKNPEIMMPLRIAYRHPDKIEHLANKTVEWCFHGDYSIDNFVTCYNYLYFIYPILKIAEWRSLEEAPTYLYKYSYESKRSMIKEGLWTTYKGAAHVEDLTYIFRTDSLMGDYVSFPPQNDDDRMKQWWVTIVKNFVHCGNPTCTVDESRWPPLRRGRLQYQDISKPMQYRMKGIDTVYAEWLRFFEGVDEEVRAVTDKIKKKAAARMLQKPPKDKLCF